jgi:DNA polymerase-1
MNKYLEILNKIELKEPPKQDDHILIIDSLNTFIRNFSMVKSINPSGNHVGGMIGFLRSLGYMVRILEPTQVICVFDGRGASMNRKNIDSNYKANRENIRITNWGMFDSKQEEKDSMNDQIQRLHDYLECLPVTSIIYDKIEADDIISFIAQHKASKGSKVTIVSSDKDFFQIVNENISIYSPIKKKVYNLDDVKKELGVTPENYLIIKALIGDQSDNLPGVKRAGTKTILKLFPNLLNEEKQTLEYIYNTAEENLQSKKTLFANIIYQWELVQRNFKLMNLQNPRLTEEEKFTILEDISTPSTNLYKGTFLRYLEQDKVEGITNNTENWLQTFNSLTVFKSN